MRERRLPPYLLSIVVLAVAYAGAGWVALQLAVPPGYAAPAFPPAGIALSALLIFGLRLWPGIFIGSLIVQLLANGSAAVETLSPLVLLMVPAGATLQAVAGALLAQRLIGFPNPLDAPGTIVRFLALVAPASCLISPSIAIPVLHFGGVITAEDAGFNWWNWWIGDTLGVIVAAPLMFVFFGRPASDWRARRIGVGMPLIVALLVLAFAFRQVLDWEEVRVQTQFDRDTQHLTSQIGRRLEAQMDMMLSIKGLLSVSENVTRAEFRAFIEPWLERYPGTQNFGWSPLISDSERSALERAVRREGFTDFRILDRKPDGTTQPAASAAEYLPITLLEPLATNIGALGLNPLSLPATADAIRQTRLTGAPAATESFRLVQGRAGQKGVVVYLAVSRERSSAATAAPPLMGVISAVFRMDDALTGALAGADAAGMDICVADVSAAPERQRLTGPQGCEQHSWLGAKLSRRAEVAFAGRTWEIRLRPRSAYINAIRTWVAWGTVASGLLAVGLLGAFLLITTGNTRRIAALVDRRTGELEAATASLSEKQAALTEAQRIARMGSWELVSSLPGLHCSSELHHLLDCAEGGLDTLDDLVCSVVPADRARLRGQIARVEYAPGRVTLDCRTDGARPRILQFRVESEWHDGALTRMRGTVQDVTSAREAEAHIQYLARYDTLTDLPNRSAWLDLTRAALQAAERHGGKLAVLFLDLDNFKTINDSLGHPIGDRLLAAVAGRLGSCIRAEDKLARLGGDEFVAMLPRVAWAEDAAAVARKMLQVLAEPVRIDNHDLRPTVSIGIALFPDDGREVDVLLKHADTAMYGAKAAGRNNYQFFIPEMNARAIERLELEGALRLAIQRSQLKLHYQPQIDITTGHAVGCEALVRWQHPERGLIPPAQFIPVAEASGLIIPLGEWVLREACRQQVRWAQAGLGNLMVAVNISALQFQRRDFFDAVKGILAETGANPAHIELEITESALMDSGDDLAARLKMLVDHGLTLALDDFGTGYSCLSYLKRLPLARIKIDRSFIADLPGNTEDAAVVTAALSMARDLGMEVVAEGVESAAQRAFLAERQCRLMQGYLFARPLEAAAFDAWVRSINLVSA